MELDITFYPDLYFDGDDDFFPCIMPLDENFEIIDIEDLNREIRNNINNE